MRILYMVPVMHTLHEMDTVAEMVLRKMGSSEEEYIKAVRKFWDGVERFLQRESLYNPETASKLHIFLDGMPITEKQAIILRVIVEIAQEDSPMCRIAKALHEQGAHIHGVEDPAIANALLEGLMPEGEGREVDTSVIWETLAGRDQGIIKHIDATVPDDETGLLFIGMVHKAIIDSEELQRNFQVIMPRKEPRVKE